MVGFWHWHIPTFIITDISPPWWNFVMVGIMTINMTIMTIIMIITIRMRRQVGGTLGQCGRLPDMLHYSERWIHTIFFSAIFSAIQYSYPRKSAKKTGSREKRACSQWYNCLCSIWSISIMFTSNSIAEHSQWYNCVCPTFSICMLTLQTFSLSTIGFLSPCHLHMAFIYLWFRFYHYQG